MSFSLPRSAYWTDFCAYILSIYLCQSVCLSISQYLSLLSLSLSLSISLSLSLFLYLSLSLYIFTNLLSTSIHGYQEKRKKTPGTRDKNISNHRPGEKRKKIIGQKRKKKRKGQLRHTSWKKNQEICSQLVKRKIKPTVKCRHYKSAQYEVEPITKINLNRESEFSY